MPIGQQKAGCAVIKNSRGPGRNRVASSASRSRRRKPGRDVIRYVPANRRGTQEIWLVAIVAISRFERVVVALVTGGTGGRRRGHVCSDQSKPGDAMIERRRVPTFCHMASRTVHCGKSWSRGDVLRIICLLPGRQMAVCIPTTGGSSH